MGKPKSQRAAKVSDFAKHKPGSICRLTLENFMCTDNVTYNFNENLNFLLGANGTGKSTIVCALYLIFDGNIKSLGRCGNLREFINNERNRNGSKITVALKKRNGDLLRIKRLWGGERGGSGKWQLRDGGDDWRDLRKDELYKVMKEFNISVENLFQFLPQEKVNDLNDLKPVDRLEGFQQAISDGRKNLKEKHEELITFQKERADMGSTLAEKKQKLADLIASYDRQKGKIETFKKYKEFRTDLRWTNLQVLKTIHDQAVVERVYAESDYKDWEEQHQEAQQKHMGKLKADKKILEKKFEKQKKLLELEPENQSSQISKYVNELEKTRKNVLYNTKKVMDEKRAIEDLEKKVLKTKSDIKRKEADIKLHQDSYNRGLAEFEIKKAGWNEQLQVLEAEEEELRMQGLPARRQKYELKKAEVQEKEDERKLVDNRIKRESNTETRREDALRAAMSRSDRDFETILKVKHWIEEHKHEFQNNILMPALFSINAEDEGVKVLLDVVGQDDLETFICFSQEDNDKLFRVIQKAGYRGISTAFYDESQLDLAKWKANSFPFKKYGFSHLLVDEIEGPEKLIAFLCQEARIHLIPWTNKPMKEDELNYMLELNQEERLNRYYTFGNDPTVTHRRRMEFGDGGISEKYDSFVPREYYDYKPYDIRFDTEVIAQLEEEKRNVDKARLEVEHDMNSARKLYEEGSKRARVLKKEIEKLILQINEKQGSKNEERKLYNDLQKLMENVIDFPRIYMEKKTLQAKFAKKAAEHGKTYVTLQENLLKKCKIDPNEVLKLLTLKRDIADTSQKLEEMDQKLIDQRHQGEQFKRVMNEAHRHEKNIHSDYKQKADELFGSITEAGKRLKAKFPRYHKKKHFNDLEESKTYTRDHVTELEADRQKHTTNIASLMVDEEITEESVREHNQLDKKIAEHRKALERVESNISNADERTSTLRENWLPVLQHEIKKVSERLHANFKRIQCEGRIELQVPDDEHDYKNYGLVIKARYREGGTLQEVTTARHSGGERSVAAMLFLLSMPTKNCPFRLVDEINQGMDQYNERNVLKVVKELTDDSPVDDLCQFFIISPKLLMNLDYPKRSKVTVIHNMHPCFPRKANNTANELQRYKNNDEAEKEM